jgi:hypothetical protein
LTAQQKGISTVLHSSPQGKLGEALAETVEYVSATNEKFVDGLSKSRNQLLSSLDALFGGDMKLEGGIRRGGETLF